jgi:hypothetical protein
MFSPPGSPTLTVIGNPNQPHNIQISDDGHGDIKVVCDGVRKSFSHITNLNIFGGNHGNSVTYQMTGPLTETENVFVHLRPGNDKFVGVLQQDFQSGGNLNLRVDAGPQGTKQISLVMMGSLRTGSSLNFTAGGGPAKDLLNFTMLGSVDAGANLAVNLVPGAAGVQETVSLLGNKTLAGTVSLNLVGGPKPNSETVNVFDNIDATGFVSISESGTPGADTEGVNFLGQDLGVLQVQANGGTAADTFAVNINLAPGSDGVVLASEIGGPGNDTLTLAVRKQLAGDTPVIVATVDGGAGFNHCFITPNVMETNCQVVTFI